MPSLQNPPRCVLKLASPTWAWLTALSSLSWMVHSPPLALASWMDTGSPMPQPCGHMHYFEPSHLLLQPCSSSSSSLGRFNPSSNITTGPSNRWILYMKDDSTYSKFHRLFFPYFHCKNPLLKGNVSHTGGARCTEKSQKLPDCFCCIPKPISGVLKWGPNLCAPSALSPSTGESPAASPGHRGCSRGTSGC